MEESGPESTDAKAVLGRTIGGKFLIASYLGGGAVGAVYKARHVALDKDVAIKLLHGEHAGDAMFAARFEREAKAASKLDHPNSMRVLDFGVEPDGLAYIAMEYLDGRDLFKVMTEESLSPERMADIVAQALAAVAAANAMGIVHRDLKPENIMILRGADEEGNPRDVVKVCDFGIAKFMEDRGSPIDEGERKLTQHGIVVGTPEYMSPEQCRGEPLDVRSDLYAMGVILYQLLTGRTPFQAETALGIVLKQISDEPLAPRTVNPMADERLEVICLKAMKKRREQRYQSAREMRADLRVIVGTWSAEPPSYSSPILDRPVLASVKPTEKWLTRQPPAEDESTATLSAPVLPAVEASVEVAPPPESEATPDPPPPEAAPSSPVLPGPSRTQRMKAREERGPTGPTGTALMKAREERGPTGTVLMKGRVGRGPTGTVLMKARAGGPAPGGARAWLVVVAALGALAVAVLVWTLVRR